MNTAPTDEPTHMAFASTTRTTTGKGPPASALSAQRIDAVRSRLRKLVADSEEERWVGDDAVRLLGELGAWNVVVPRRYGGFDLPLKDQVEIVSAIARSDGSLGWVTSLWYANSRMAALYPLETQEEVFTGGPTRVSGSLAPSGELISTDGGFLLTGVWRGNTGSRGAAWHSLSAMLRRPGGEPEVVCCLVPSSELKASADWDAFGALAIGNSEVRAEQILVPGHRTISLVSALAGRPVHRLGKADLRTYALFPYTLTLFSSVFVGMAEATLDLFLERLPGRGIAHTPWTDQQASPVTHVQVAAASNRITAARSLLAHVVETVENGADGDGTPSAEQGAAVRGHAAFIVDLCREAVSNLYRASGPSAVLRSVPLQQFFRDVETLAQHASVLVTSNYEVHGRVIVGLDPGTPFV